MVVFSIVALESIIARPINYPPYPITILIPFAAVIEEMAEEEEEEIEGREDR